MVWAVEKIWLQPLKIWELVRDDMVPKIANGVVVPSSDQVSFESLYIIVYVCNVLHLLPTFFLVLQFNKQN